MEQLWISQVLKTSLYTCHGLRTPLTRHTLVITVALHGLRRRYKPRQSGFIIGAIPTLQEHAFPMAYIILCLRFTLFVRLIASSRRKVISNLKLRTTRKTRYEWPTGTFTLQDALSFACRTNEAVEKLRFFVELLLTVIIRIQC